MILEKELYNSINATRSAFRSARVYFYSMVTNVLSKDHDLNISHQRGLPRINRLEDCNTCGDCEIICPTNCLTLKSKDEVLTSMILDVKACTLCGLCSDVCSPKAILTDDVRRLSSHFESSWKIDLVSSLNE